jgi:hypothetical protein
MQNLIFCWVIVQNWGRLVCILHPTSLNICSARSSRNYKKQSFNAFESGQSRLHCANSRKCIQFIFIYKAKQTKIGAIVLSQVRQVHKFVCCDKLYGFSTIVVNWMTIIILRVCSTYDDSLIAENFGMSSLTRQREAKFAKSSLFPTDCVLGLGKRAPGWLYFYESKVNGSVDCTHAN